MDQASSPRPRSRARTAARLTVELDVDVCVIGAGLAGPDGGARGGPARLVGGGAGGARASPGTPRVATPASCCRAMRRGRRRWSAGSASTMRKSSGRCRRPGPNMSGARCKMSSAEQMPGVALSEGGWLHVTKTNDEHEVQAEAELLGKLGAEGRIPAGRAGEGAAALAALFQRAALSARLQHSFAELRAGIGRGRRARRRRASTRTARRCRSIRPVCASASAPRMRGCAPIMSCWPATSISPS